jgi:hypothetical protein
MGKKNAPVKLAPGASARITGIVQKDMILKRRDRNAMENMI